MMDRVKLLAVCLLCTVLAPILVVAMLCQALFGSKSRAWSMAIALDSCGNALFGGEPTETISRRTGLAQKAGKRWALIVAPCIDFFFGKGHCAANAE